MLKGLVAINIAAIIFGSAALYGKLDVSPFWLVCMRGMFAAVTLLLFALSRNELLIPSRKSFLPLLITGTILAAHWLTFFLSVQVSGVAIATLTFAAFPLFTLIIEIIDQHKKLSLTSIGAGFLIIIAVSMLVNIDIFYKNVLIGSIYGLISALLFAYFGIMSKKLTTRMPTLTVSFYQNVTVCLVLLPFLPKAIPFPDKSGEWMFLVMLGVINTALMHQLYFYALKRLSAGTCSGFVALEPVYAIFFAALFFSEPVSITIVISGILILVASYIILKS